MLKTETYCDRIVENQVSGSKMLISSNPEGWDAVPLGEVAHLHKGVTYKSEDYCEKDNGVIFFNLKCVSKSGGFNSDGIKYYNGPVQKNDFIAPGDIVIANTDLTRNGDIVGCPVEIPEYYKDKAVCISMDLTKIIPNELLNKKFFYYFLQLPYCREFMKSHSNGSTVLHLDLKAVKNLLIFLPSLYEQHKIAAILSSVDAAIEQTDAIIDVLKTIKVGITKDLLYRGLDECGHLRDPVTHPEQFMDSDLGIMPTGWNTSKVGDLGLWRGGSTPSKSSPLNWSAGDILWISPKDVLGDELIDSEDKITQEALFNYKMKLFNAGDILVVFRSGILRHTFPIAITKLPFTVNQDIKVLSPKIGVHNRFAFFVLQALGPVVLRSAVKSGTTVESIDYKTFRDLVIFLPSEDEQKRIAKILDAYNARITNEKTYLNKLKQLTHCLMQDLLTGRVRVKVDIHA